MKQNNYGKRQGLSRLSWYLLLILGLSVCCAGFAEEAAAIDEKAADVNGDEKVDGRDVLRLAKLLAGV